MSYDVYWVKNCAEKIADFEHPTFWDTEEETLVIATHGIVKKTQKTPLKEITKAEEIRKEYFNNKNK